MINSLESKIDRLEKEINRCLQEKRQCDDRLEQLEHHHEKLTQADSKTGRPRGKKEAKTVQNSSQVQAMGTEEIGHMVTINQGLKDTTASMEENLRQLQEIIEQLSGTSIDGESRESDGHGENSEVDQVSDSTDEAGSNVSEDTGGSDLMLDMLSGLLSSPELLKLLPVLLKQLAK